MILRQKVGNLRLISSEDIFFIENIDEFFSFNERPGLPLCKYGKPNYYYILEADFIIMVSFGQKYVESSSLCMEDTTIFTSLLDLHPGTSWFDHMIFEHTSVWK